MINDPLLPPPPREKLPETWADHYHQLSVDELDQEYYRPRSAGEIPLGEVGVGAAFAGMALPVVLAINYLAIGLLWMILSGQPLPVGEIPGALVGWAVAALIVASGSFIVHGLVAIVTLPLLAAAAGLIGIRARLTPVACFSGGLVTFVLTSPAWISLSTSSYLGSAEWIVFLLLEALAIACGQLGAGLLVMNNRLGPWRRRPADQPPAPAGNPIRFSVRQVLMLMVVLSVALAVLQALQLLTPSVLLRFLFWLGYQFALAAILTRLIDWRRGQLIKRQGLNGHSGGATPNRST